MRKQVLLDPGEEDRLVFETLRGVERHERDRAARVIQVIRGGHERGLGQKVEEGSLRIVPVELFRHCDEFLDVFGPGFILRVSRCAQCLDEAGLRQQGNEDVPDRSRVGGERDLIENGAEAEDGAGDLRSETHFVRVPERLAQRDLVSVGIALQCGLGDATDSALRSVQDAAERHRVGGVGDGDQVPERVLDLGAFVELGAAEHPVRQGGADEDLLQCSRLRVGTVEHRDIPVLEPRAVQFGDLVRDELRFVVLAVPGEADDLVAVADGREQFLVFAVEVVRNDRVGRAQNVLRRAVVLFEQHDLRVRKVAFELDDVADVRAPERIDRLIGVADHGQ